MSSFHLKIWKIEQTCIFELSWDRGQQLNVKLPFPPALMAHYQTWQQIYFNFYRSGLRAKVKMSGGMPPPSADWRAQLVQAEAQLLAEFHHWLSSAELLPIRQEIARALAGSPLSAPLDLFLTCDAIDLARLPWETWELGTEFAATRTLRIARTAANIRAVPPRQRRWGKLRILAILGDDTGLSLWADQAAMQSLSPIADVVFVGGRSPKEATDLIEQIRQTIADPQGWDILFFAGHSNETSLTGGELAIAPNLTILLSEIAPQLIQAKEQGLQFAIFNSCNGLTIANLLIDLGLSQVVVMREPIHNRVAQEFLVRFLQGITAQQDVHDATVFACQHLKLERNLTYPSSYLVPSLFRHPDTEPFQLKVWGWQRRVKQWLPTRREAIAVTTLVALSLFPPLSLWLLEQRVLVQAIYHHHLGALHDQQSPIQTSQIGQSLTEPPPTGQSRSVPAPPVVLVQIDELSLHKAQITNPKPMPRDYLAKLVRQVAALDARVVGIDYLLDRPHPADPDLQKGLRAALEKQRTWYVFAASQSRTGNWLRVTPQVASPNWSLQGDTWVPFWHIKPLPWLDTTPPPFAFLLATAHRLETESFETPDSPLPVPQPRWQNTEDLGTQVMTYAQKIDPATSKPLITESMQLQDITALSYSIYQRWLQPILDFSLPPTQVYIPIPAWQLLEQPDQVLKLHHLSSLQSAIVIIAAGGYDEAGIENGEDNFDLPAAIAYWRQQLHSPNHSLQNQNLQNRNHQNHDRSFSGGEAHAYMTHHFLTHHLVIPIPDLWLILAMIPIGKTLSLVVKHRRRSLLPLAGATLGYGVISLHLYLSAVLLLPWLFPSATLWIYILLTQRQRNHV